MVIPGGFSVLWLITPVFFRLVVRLKFWQAWENLYMILQLFLQRRVSDKCLLDLGSGFTHGQVEQFVAWSVLEAYTISWVSKGMFQHECKGMPSRVGARTQLCLTPLQMLNVSGDAPCIKLDFFATPFVGLPSRNDWVNTTDVWLIFRKILNGPSRLTRLTAFIRPMKTM